MKKRTYQCSRCHVKSERGRVVAHFYKHHIPLEEAPHYCTLCMFRAQSRAELEKHVRSYSLHVTRRTELINKGAYQGESKYLKESLRPYYLKLGDILLVGEKGGKPVPQYIPSPISNLATAGQQNLSTSTVTMATSTMCSAVATTGGQSSHYLQCPRPALDIVSRALEISDLEPEDMEEDILPGLLGEFAPGELLQACSTLPKPPVSESAPPTPPPRAPSPTASSASSAGSNLLHLERLSSAVTSMGTTLKESIEENTKVLRELLMAVQSQNSLLQKENRHRSRSPIRRPRSRSPERRRVLGNRH